MAATRGVKGQIATRGILAYAQRYDWQCGGAHTNMCVRVCVETHTHTHSDSQLVLQQRGDERACSSIWRGGGGRREDWGGWVHVGWEEGGVRSASALTD